MVQIPTQVSQVKPDPYQATGITLDDSVGQGLRNMGTAVGNLGSALRTQMEAARLKEQRKESQDAWIGLQGVDQDLTHDLTIVDQNSTPNGDDIAPTFNDEYLTPKTDAFLATIKDPEVREEYTKRLELLKQKHKDAAVEKQYERGKTYSKSILTDQKSAAGSGIALDPVNFEKYVADFEKQVDEAPNLTAAEKDEIKRKWRQDAPAVLAEQLQKTDPDAAYYATGHGTPEERRKFVSDRVIAAVIKHESAGDPTQVSRKGALGLMQVMPETAIEIAKDLGDKKFLDMTSEQQKEHLQREDVSIKYGSYYLSKMLKQNGNNLTLALIAYNAGQQRADEFKQSGGDWSKMGKWKFETAPYVQKILGAIGTTRFAVDTGVTPDVGLGTGKRLPLKFQSQGGRQPVNTDTSKVDRSLVDKWELVQGAFGKQLPIVSSYRDAAVNAKAGGAQHSQHLQGTAFDIDVSSLSTAERIRLLKIASAAGMRGIGIYDNSIHFDVRAGSRQVWGSSHHGDSIPGWAQGFAQEHERGEYGGGAGTTITSGSGGPGKVGGGEQPARVALVGQEKAGLSYGSYDTKSVIADQTQLPDGTQEAPYLNDAFKDLGPQNIIQITGDADAAKKAADAAAKLAAEQAKTASATAAQEDLASVAQTGEGTVKPGDMEDFTKNIEQTQGPEAVTKYTQDRAVAQAVYNTTKDIRSMTADEMNSLENTPPQGGLNSQLNQRVFDETNKKIAEERTRRAADPALAVQNSPQVAAELAAVQANPKDAAAWEAYFAKVQSEQARLGMPPQLLPKPKIQDMGRRFTDYMKRNYDKEPEDVAKAFLNDYHQQFGAFGDEIFTEMIESTVDSQLTKETKSLMSTTMLDWIKDKPEYSDPGYRRNKEKQSWNWLPEIAAQDKVNLTTEPADEEQPGWGVFGTVKDWMTGGSAPPEQPPLQPPPPRAEGAPGSAQTAYQQQTGMRTKIHGVPDERLDELISNPGDKKVQSAFRQTFGEVAFGEAQNFLKQGAQPGALSQ